VAAVAACAAPVAGAATITVQTTADDGTPGDGTVSLREAIAAIDAGNDLGDPDITADASGPFGTGDEIVFGLQGPGVPAITPSSALPPITKPLTIAGVSGVALDGAAAGLATGIVARAPVVLEGLDIQHFELDGVRLEAGSDGSIVTGNRIWFNGGAGIADRAGSDVFRLNSIAGNRGGGILAGAGAPAGSVTLGPDHRTVSVDYSGAAPGQLVIADAFDNPASPRCPGQGYSFIGSASAPANLTGAGTITLALPSPLAPGDGLTATVTGAVNGTSSFACVAGGVPLRPGLSGVTLSPPVFKAPRGTTLSLTLSEPATVLVRITRTIHGRRFDGSCIFRERRGPPCTKTTLKVMLAFSGVAGANGFSLRVRNLSPGSYTAAVTAVNAGNLRSTAVVVKLRIKT
jgi:hypothetical protein